jgi:diketogulonate reductase-like aldo/keto reductase
MEYLTHRGEEIPLIGFGTYRLGENETAAELETLRYGVDKLGMTLMDTAEMYGSGRSEALVGEAIAPYDREKLFIVSKVLPQNAGRKGMRRSCEGSLKRLKTDYLDLYLYHWIGDIPLPETVECLQGLKDSGLIREWGVSNFDTADMKALEAVKYGKNCAAVQDLYHIGSRGTEFSLKPYLANGYNAPCPND